MSPPTNTLHASHIPREMYTTKKVPLNHLSYFGVWCLLYANASLRSGLSWNLTVATNEPLIGRRYWSRAAFWLDRNVLRWRRNGHSTAWLQNSCTRSLIAKWWSFAFGKNFSFNSQPSKNFLGGTDAYGKQLRSINNAYDGRSHTVQATHFQLHNASATKTSKSRVSRIFDFVIPLLERPCRRVHPNIWLKFRRSCLDRRQCTARRHWMMYRPLSMVSCMSNHPLEMQHKRILCGNWNENKLLWKMLLVSSHWPALVYSRYSLQACQSFECNFDSLNVRSSPYSCNVPLYRTMPICILNECVARNFYAHMPVRLEMGSHLPLFASNSKMMVALNTVASWTQQMYLPNSIFIVRKSQNKQTKHLPDITWMGFCRSKYSSGVRTDDHACRVCERNGVWKWGIDRDAT